MSSHDPKEAASLLRVPLPGLGGYMDCMECVSEYMQRADLSAADLALRVGVARSSVNLFVQGRYSKITDEWRYMAARLVDFITRHPIDVTPFVAKGNLFETENYRRIHSYFHAAIERGEVSLLYGPPGTQKSFVLSHLIAERNRQGKNDALMIYAAQNVSPLPLLKAIGRAAGVMVGWHHRDRVKENIIFDFRKRGNVALIIDEAQHLTVDALEIVRELHDRTGCGLILAGSHNLLEYFLHKRALLEQWLSRIDHKEPLPGLLESEIREIAARELGNGRPMKLSDKQFAALLDNCRVDDIFARDLNGKSAPRKYFSVRRLVKVIDQYKAAKRQTA